MTEPTATPWPTALGAITMFVGDVAASREFYRRAFGLPVHYEDEDSVVFALGTTLLNLLAVGEASALVDPAPVGGPRDGVRVQLTVNVPDVDATCEELARRGVTLLNCPMDRPWGMRTAAFRDPDGHTWEIAGPSSGRAAAPADG